MSQSAERIVSELRKREQSITFAESLTGGAVVSEIVAVPGASHVLKGSIVAYSSEVKTRELSVDPQLISQFGVVSKEVAVAMALGAKVKFLADWSVALTGVAGPGPSHGIAAGTVWLAVVGPGREETVELSLDGDREMVRRGAVESALGLLERILTSDSPR